MIPTQTRFRPERLCWFTLEFFEEFGRHPPWQCRIVHPAMGAAFHIEQSDDSWDVRERLTKLLASITRLAMFDNTTHFLSQWLGGIAAAGLALAMPLGGMVKALAGFGIGVWPILGATFVVQVGTGYVLFLILYRVLCAVINHGRGRAEYCELHLGAAAKLYAGGIQIAAADIDRLKMYRIYGLYEYHRDFWSRVRLDRAMARIRAERLHVGSE